MRKIITLLMVLSLGVSVMAVRVTNQLITYNVWENGEAEVYDVDKSLTDVVVPSTFEHEGKTYEVKKVGRMAFSNNSKIESVVLPEGMVEIGYRAFGRMSSLKKVTIPNSVTKVGDACFEGCASLTQVEWGTGLREVSSRMFADCSGLKAIELPEGIEKINGGSFSNCTSLKKIVFPKSVKSFRYGALMNCTQLETVVSFIEDPVAVEFIGGFGKDCTLYVQKEYITAYENSSWRQWFKAVKAYDATVGIETASVANGIAGVYRCGGELVGYVQVSSGEADLSALEPGVYVIGGKKYVK